MNDRHAYTCETNLLSTSWDWTCDKLKLSYFEITLQPKFHKIIKEVNKVLRIPFPIYKTPTFLFLCKQNIERVSTLKKEEKKWRCWDSV